MNSSLSVIQAAMLRHSLAHPDGAYIEQAEIGYMESLSAERVRDAWRETVVAAEVLRSGFRFDDGEPAAWSVPMGGTDGIEIRAGMPSCWEEWLREDRLRPFDLDGGTPWRVVIWPDLHRFVWTFHHALLDGRSITRILRLFAARLGGSRDAEGLALAVSPQPDDGQIEAAITFHRDAFSKVGHCEPEFPMSCGEARASVRFSLGVDRADRLEMLARRTETTPATLVTWAWGQVIAAATGAAKVAVAQVRAGARCANTAGFTMKTVPLVIDRAGEESVADALQSFRRIWIAMRSIEDVPADVIPAAVFHESGGPWAGGVIMVESGTLDHETGGSPWIRSAVLHEQAGEKLIAGAWIRPELTLDVEVDGIHFGREAAETLASAWRDVLIRLADGADADAAAASVFPGDGLSQLESGGPEIARQHLATAWKQSVAAHADQPALLADGKSFTYGDLDARVECLADRIARLISKPDERVASLLVRRTHVALVQLATARAGMIHVPLDPALPESRIAGILEDSSPSVLLTDQPERCRAYGLPLIDVGEDTGGMCAAPLPSDPAAVLSILYTSGSTGVPKGVMMVHGGVVNEGLAMARSAGIGPGDRVLQFASPGFDASLEEITMTLLGGATLVPRPEHLAADLDEFHAFIAATGITVLDLSTAHWAAWCAWMAAEGKRIPACVRTTIIGGERATAAALAQWRKAGGTEHLLLNTYGPTEASVVATMESIGAHWNESGDPAIGRPLAGVRARVGDAEGRPLLKGAAGELWLGGIGIGPGYWRRPELTASSFRRFDDADWYRTGDRVCHDSSGKLRFLGRRDDQLKIRGNRVEPDEVVRVLEGHDGVVAAHVGPVSGADGAIALAAWVRWANPPDPQWPRLLAMHVASSLPAACVPSRWAAVAAFPLNERGKLDRRRLPEPDLTARAGGNREMPSTATERSLAAIWSELLGISAISRDDSFFDLGGHSLMALRLFARIGRMWHVRVPMAMLMQAPTLAGLAALIDSGAGGRESALGPRPVIVSIRAEGGLHPLFCIHGGDGGVFFYRGIADSLPAGRPMLAIEAPMLSSSAPVNVGSVSETARSYLSEIRSRQTGGPYHLIGYSYGGLLVYEIACQLHAAGEAVAFVGLIDTVNPAADIREYTMRERLEVFWRAQEGRSAGGRVWRVCRRLIEGAANHWRLKFQTRGAMAAADSAGPYSGARMIQIREAHSQAMDAYRPGPLDLPIHLFKSDAVDDKHEIPDDYGWRSVAREVHVVEAPGRHLTMFDHPHVDFLARNIASCL